MSTPPIIATYLIETPIAVEQAAEMIAGEQSSGTFLPVPGETEELKARARARVIDIKLLDAVEQPSLRGSKAKPGADGKLRFQRAEIKIAFPFDNIGCNIPTLAVSYWTWICQKRLQNVIRARSLVSKGHVD
jgi:ribulose-bisphosphate carboxylase large chain